MFAEPLEVQFRGERCDLVNHRHVDRHSTGKRKPDSVSAEYTALRTLFEFLNRTDNAVKAPAGGLLVFEAIPQPVGNDVDILNEVRGISDNRWNRRIIQQSNERSHTLHCIT